MTPLFEFAPQNMSYHSFQAHFENKKILLFGFGILGGGKGSLTIFQTFPCEIVITDQKTEDELDRTFSQISKKNIHHLTLGKHIHEDIDWADIIIKNPAVPTSNEYIQYALKRGKHVTTDPALYLKYSESTVVGITGTRGKTTTTMLTHHLLSTGLAKSVLLGGNIMDIGSLPLLSKETQDSIVVLELSSFALEGCHWEKVSPHIAAITNLYPDHMNRHTSMEEYAYEKSAIFAYQHSDDYLFLNTQNEWTPVFQKEVKSHLKLVSPDNVPGAKLMPLKGEHNRYNAAFAISIAKQLGVSQTSIQENIVTFKGAPYRQQNLGTFRGITFINDSTSTTPEAVMAALETFPTGNFIIGGTTKFLDLTKFATELQHFKGHLFFLNGSGTTELLTKMGEKIKVYNTLNEAFSEATLDSPSEVVFSPGFTSFELFKNEFDRAEQFSTLVHTFSQQ